MQVISPIQWRKISIRLEYHSNPAPTTHAKEAEVIWFYEDLQDLLELTLQKDVCFITGDWNAKVGSQEIPEVTEKFDLGSTKWS